MLRQRRHRTAAWIVTLVAVALLWLGVRDQGAPGDVPAHTAIPVLLAIAAIAVLGVALSRRRRRSNRPA